MPARRFRYRMVSVLGITLLGVGTRAERRQLVAASSTRTESQKVTSDYFGKKWHQLPPATSLTKGPEARYLCPNAYLPKIEVLATGRK